MKKTTKFFFSLLLALGIILNQVGGVFAAPALQEILPLSGIVQSITLKANTVTGVTLVSIDVIDDNQALQSVRVSLETAIAHGLVVLNGDGKPSINDSALGRLVEIEPSSIIPAHQENQHPVGSALATFFSDISGMDYEAIMSAHDQGLGFGVIAQILWLTTKLEGNADVFEELIHAKQTGDFGAFILEDGSTPKNWGQLKKAILDKDDKNNLGVVISDSNTHGNGSNNNPGNNGNNENGGGNSHGGGNGNGNGNGGGNRNGNGHGNDK